MLAAARAARTAASFCDELRSVRGAERPPASARERPYAPLYPGQGETNRKSERTVQARAFDDLRSRERLLVESGLDVTHRSCPLS